jgi:hypothetical protein
MVSYRLFVSKEPQDRVSLISRSRAHVISSTSREKKKNKEGQKKNIVGLFFTLCCTRGLRKKRGAEKSFFFVDFPSYLEGKRSVVFLLLSRKNKHSSHTHDLAFLYARTHTHTHTHTDSGRKRDKRENMPRNSFPFFLKTCEFV